MSQFTEVLVVSPLADGKTWIVQREFGYDRGVEGSGDRIEVKIGFMTDFASVPRPLWWFLSPWGKYGNAAVIHDWLYWSQGGFVRAEADGVFLEAMTVLGVPARQKYPMYWGVRLFGWLAWSRNQWDREAGFDRVISPKKVVKSIESSERPGLMRRAWRHMRRPAAPTKS